MASKRRRLSKCKDMSTLQKRCLILDTSATIATAIASLTAVAIELLRFLL